MCSIALYFAAIEYISIHHWYTCSCTSMHLLTNTRVDVVMIMKSFLPHVLLLLMIKGNAKPPRHVHRGTTARLLRLQTFNTTRTLLIFSISARQYYFKRGPFSWLWIWRMHLPFQVPLQTHPTLKCSSGGVAFHKWISCSQGHVWFQCFSGGLLKIPGFYYASSVVMKNNTKRRGFKKKCNGYLNP